QAGGAIEAAVRHRPSIAHQLANRRRAFAVVRAAISSTVAPRAGASPAITAGNNAGSVRPPPWPPGGWAGASGPAGRRAARAARAASIGRRAPGNVIGPANENAIPRSRYTGTSSAPPE